MTRSLITSEVDFAAPGKQAGFLRLPHSVHRSAYGWIPVPVVVIANGAGPAVLMTGGVHGDEYEGQIALSRLARELAPADIRGRLIVLPMANFPAAEAGLRVSPLDHGNLNRSFPGDAQGGPTGIIAHYIEEVLMALCDICIDLHSGGTSLFYPPTLLRGPGATAPEADMLARLQAAFDLPYAWVFGASPGRSSTGRTAMAAANRKGVTCVMAELGGGGAVTPEILARTERGLRRILHDLGMLPGYAPDAAQGTREVTVLGSVPAHDPGLFEPLAQVGDTVSQGQQIATIHDPATPWAEPVAVAAPHTGLILCQRALGQVRRGDALFQIAGDRS